MGLSVTSESKKQTIGTEMQDGKYLYLTGAVRQSETWRTIKDMGENNKNKCNLDMITISEFMEYYQKLLTEN